MLNQWKRWALVLLSVVAMGVYLVLNWGAVAEPARRILTLLVTRS